MLKTEPCTIQNGTTDTWVIQDSLEVDFFTVCEAYKTSDGYSLHKCGLVSNGLCNITSNIWTRLITVTDIYYRQTRLHMTRWISLYVVELQQRCALQSCQKQHAFVYKLLQLGFCFRLFLEVTISDNNPHLENHFSTKRNDKPLAFLKKQNHLY